MPAVRHLYFHIPFCPKLCPYCSFYVETGAKNKTTRFLDALLREVEALQATHTLRPETIYFGGGTPSALTCDQLEYLLFAGLRSRLDLRGLREWTFEVNPATVRADKASACSTTPASPASASGCSVVGRRAVENAGAGAQRGAGGEDLRHSARSRVWQNINIDLDVFAVPGQTLAQWQATLDRTIALRLRASSSSYCLTYEEDTEYFRQLQLGTFRQDDDRDAALFETTIDTLTAAGFEHYEISNYARPGFESAHNFAYWRGADLPSSFGPSAFSPRSVPVHRWQNVPDTAAYMDTGACRGKRGAIRRGIEPGHASR